jgi:uncharacterized protein YndB with AHSA1/START domain
MTDRSPDATDVRVIKEGEKWTLILVRELRHSPEKIWQALTDPAHLRQWAPFDADGNLGAVGSTVHLTWVGNPTRIEATVTQSDPPRLLEFGDIRWELEPSLGGTRLTLWHKIDRRFVAWGAAGWHICFDVLVQVLSGIAVARMAGADAVKSKTWQRLKDEYTKQFGASNGEHHG